MQISFHESPNGISWPGEKNEASPLGIFKKIKNYLHTLKSEAKVNVQKRGLNFQPETSLKRDSGIGTFLLIL